MADAAVDRMAAEAKDRVDIPLEGPVIGLLSSKVKHAIHEKINEAGEEDEPKQQEGEAPQPQPEGGEEPKEEKKGGLSGLLEKLTRK